MAISQKYIKNPLTVVTLWAILFQKRKDLNHAQRGLSFPNILTSLGPPLGLLTYAIFLIYPVSWVWPESKYISTQHS